MFERGDPMQQS